MTVNYDPKSNWAKVFASGSMAWPSEYVIRIFKGSYPRLVLRNTGFNDKSICDAGFGDARNIPLLAECGFSNISGFDISDSIVSQGRDNLKQINVDADLRRGRSDDIPFLEADFDYLLSWNSCYYMGGVRNFSLHVKEYARVVKPEGWLVISIPKSSCFIYRDSDVPSPNTGYSTCYRIIRNDPFGVRDGEVLRRFEGEKDIMTTFSPWFDSFIFADIHDDCFGLNYHWHVAVARRTDKLINTD